MSCKEQDIGRQMEQYIADNEMAGAALIVRIDGKEVYRSKWGYANIEKQIPVEYNTVYRLASMSKPVTAIAIMILIEQGKLDLDDPITRFLPDYADLKVCGRSIGLEDAYQPDPDHPAGDGYQNPFKDMTYVPPVRMVTIRDLLSHSSGLGMGPVGMGIAERVTDYQDKLADRVAKWKELPCDFQPGEATGYSPIVGFDILGRIVEIARGMDFQSYLRKNIFEPLGIKDITFILSEEQQQRLALLYKTEDGRQVDFSDGETGLNAVNPMLNGYFSGAAGMFGTVEDYDKLVQMLTNEGEYQGVRILKADTVKRMHEEGAAKHLELGPGMAWGLGMAIFQEPGKSGLAVAPGTYGWSGAFGTHFFIDPEHKLQAVFVMNRSNIGGAGSPIARKVEEMVFGTFL